MSGCLSGNFDGPEVGPWECLRLNLGAILGTIGKAELGSGMRKSAQWKLRNHEDEDGQLPQERNDQCPCQLSLT